jgi:ubiquinone/menaquinone biosynthesis C-methylase UbiE
MDESAHTVAAERRFSDSDSAKRWTDMYAGYTERLDEANFRKRRDVAVDYVLRLLPHNGRVLDLGCGAAPVLSELRKRGVHCVGLDYAEDMLEHARERLRSMGLDDGDLHRGDCRHTLFQESAFDVVVCLGVISYVENYGKVLDEIRRVLRPGGYLIVSFRNKWNPVLCDPVRIAKTVLKAIAGRVAPEPYVIGRFMDHREVQAELAEHGFEFREFRGIGFGPFKVNYHPLFSERISIRISDALTRLLAKTGSNLLFRWFADVSLWVYKRD